MLDRVVSTFVNSILNICIIVYTCILRIKMKWPRKLHPTICLAALHRVFSNITFSTLNNLQTPSSSKLTIPHQGDNLAKERPHSKMKGKIILLLSSSKSSSSSIYRCLALTWVYLLIANKRVALISRVKINRWPIFPTCKIHKIWPSY